MILTWADWIYFSITSPQVIAQSSNFIQCQALCLSQILSCYGIIVSWWPRRSLGTYCQEKIRWVKSRLHLHVRCRQLRIQVVQVLTSARRNSFHKTIRLYKESIRNLVGALSPHTDVLWSIISLSCFAIFCGCAQCEECYWEFKRNSTWSTS